MSGLCAYTLVVMILEIHKFNKTQEENEGESFELRGGSPLDLIILFIDTAFLMCHSPDNHDVFTTTGM